jgi:hypothetical protein
MAFETTDLYKILNLVNDAKAFGSMFNGKVTPFKPRGDQPTGYYWKDHNNATRFNPENTPVRQPFNGYVNFIFNDNIKLDFLNNADFQNRLSSMVQTSTMPSAEFATTVQNQYNRKRITIASVDYKPVQVVVYDTIDSLWVTMLMKMYSHLFTNPTNKYKDSGEGTLATKTLIKNDIVPESVKDAAGSFNRPFDSNSAGLNLQPADQRNFLTSIDVVQYHGQKAIKYTLFNPIITSFEIDGINYAESKASTITMSIEYENFTMSPNVNEWMDEDDLSRFSNFYTNEWQMLKNGEKVPHQHPNAIYPLALKERKAEFLNGVSRKEQVNFLDSFSKTGDQPLTDEEANRMVEEYNANQAVGGGNQAGGG